MKLSLVAPFLALAATPALAQHEGHGAPPDAGPAHPEAHSAGDAAPSGQLHEEATTGGLGPYRHHGPAFAVGKVLVGALRDFRAAPHLRLGVGGLWAFNFVPAGLETAYGGDRSGAMLFLRVTID